MGSEPKHRKCSKRDGDGCRHWVEGQRERTPCFSLSRLSLQPSMQFAHLLGKANISIFLWSSDPFMPSLFAELSAAFRPSHCCSRAANSSDKIDLVDTRQDVMEEPGA